MERHAVTIIVGETGSGKTTQIPQYLLEAGWCAGVQCAQPPCMLCSVSLTLLTFPARSRFQVRSGSVGVRAFPHALHLNDELMIGSMHAIMRPLCLQRKA